jgi:lipooligosaccharide transport system permease protein
VKLPRFSWRAFRVWQRNRDGFFRLWKAEAPPFLAEPLFILVAMGLGLGAYVGLVDGQSYLKFIAPGIVASYAMFGATFECTYGSYVRMELQRTYDAIVATPLSIEDVIAGEIFWAATRSLMTASVILVVITAFGLVSSPLALLVPLVAVVEGLMFGSLAMFFTSVSPSVFFYNYYFTLFITPMFFFSGVFFPLTAMPEIVQRLAWLAPLTPVAYLMRGLVTGEVYLELLGGLAFMVLVTLLFFHLSLFNMRRRLIK